MIKETIHAILLLSIYTTYCRAGVSRGSDEKNRMQQFQNFLKMSGRDENNNSNNNNNNANSASGDFIDRFNRQRYRSMTGGSNQLLDEEQPVKLRELIETLLDVQCSEHNMTIKLHYDSSYSKLTSGLVRALAVDGQLYVSDKKSLCLGRSDELNGELVLTFEYDEICSVVKRSSSNNTIIYTTRVSVEFSNTTSNAHFRDFREDYTVTCVHPTNPNLIDDKYRLNLFEQKYDEIRWTYPHKVAKDSSVFVQGDVQLFGDYSNSNLHGFPVNCWLAQTSNDVNDQFRHYFLNQGCPVNDHRGKGLSRVHHLPTGQTKVSFSLINSLLWPDPNQILYVHCELLACVQNFTNGILGVPKCPSTTYCAGLPHLSHTLPEYLRHVKLYTAVAGPLNVVEKQPEISIKKDTRSPENNNGDDNWQLKCQLECAQVLSTQQQETELVQQPMTLYVEGVSVKAVVAIAFASFFVGMLMMAVLWFVHVRTDPKRKLAKYRTGSSSTATTNNNVNSYNVNNNNNSVHLRQFGDANLQQTAKLMLNPF